MVKSRFSATVHRLLNKHHACVIKMSDFEQAEVFREKGRIDIWIRDLKSKKSIIIENKMNNAPDRIGQVNDYCDYSLREWGCSVEAAVYLSIDGNKSSPDVNENVQPILRNVGAFANSNKDLVNGWLEPCKEHSLSNLEIASFLIQYMKLVKHLAAAQMEVFMIDDYYKMVGERETFSLLNKLKGINDQLLTYRTDKFVQAISHYKPFQTSFRWKHNYMIYDRFNEGEHSYKLDIHFIPDCGNASILFWDPPFPNEHGRDAVAQKLKQIGMYEAFEPYSEVKFARYFRLSDAYPTLKDVDRAITSFVQEMLEKLSATNK
jgi:hypothetical protein